MSYAEHIEAHKDALRLEDKDDETWFSGPAQFSQEARDRAKDHFTQQQKTLYLKGAGNCRWRVARGSREDRLEYIVVLFGWDQKQEEPEYWEEEEEEEEDKPEPKETEEKKEAPAPEPGKPASHTPQDRPRPEGRGKERSGGDRANQHDGRNQPNRDHLKRLRMLSDDVTRSMGPTQARAKLHTLGSKRGEKIGRVNPTTKIRVPPLLGEFFLQYCVKLKKNGRGGYGPKCDEALIPDAVPIVIARQVQNERGNWMEFGFDSSRAAEVAIERRLDDIFKVMARRKVLVFDGVESMSWNDRKSLIQDIEVKTDCWVVEAGNRRAICVMIPREDDNPARIAEIVRKVHECAPQVRERDIGRRALHEVMLEMNSNKVK